MQPLGHAYMILAEKLGPQWEVGAAVLAAVIGIIPLVWARTRIAELNDQLACTRDAKFGTEIKQVALAYGLMSNYTAFVAVDSLSKTKGSYGVAVKVPVPVPDGVRYETTVME